MNFILYIEKYYSENGSIDVTRHQRGPLHKKGAELLLDHKASRMNNLLSA